MKDYKDIIVDVFSEAQDSISFNPQSADFFSEIQENVVIYFNSSNDPIASDVDFLASLYLCYVEILEDLDSKSNPINKALFVDVLVVIFYESLEKLSFENSSEMFATFNRIFYSSIEELILDDSVESFESSCTNFCSRLQILEKYYVTI